MKFVTDNYINDKVLNLYFRSSGTPNLRMIAKSS